MRRLLLALVTLVLLAGAHAWWSYSPGAPTHALTAASRAAPLPARLRSSEEHDRVRARHGEPYVLELARPPGALLYFGAAHSEDPRAAQLDDIRRRWAAFEPTVALCEGRSRGYFLGPLFSRLLGLPEPALVHALARRDGVALLSLEPGYADEVQALIAEFAPQEVALYFTLRVYWSEAGGRANEALARELLARRTDVPGLRGALRTLEAMDVVWRRTGGEGDWRARDAGMPRDGVLARIDHASRRVRGEHMARVLIELVGRGERVLAVVGSGHVIRQEWALRAALGAAPADDQPAE